MPARPMTTSSLLRRSPSRQSRSKYRWKRAPTPCTTRRRALPGVTAAGFAVVYGTAHLALNHRAGLKPGEVLLVHAAAGGVGLAAVEVGKAMGAWVIGAAGSPEKCTLAKQHGALTVARNI